MHDNQDSGVSKTKKKVEPKQIRPSEAITLPWLIRHMTLGGWITFFGILSAVFFGGFKFAFLPLAENFGFGIQNEIVRLNDLNHRLNSKLVEVNLTLAKQVKKTTELSDKLSIIVAENRSLRDRNKKLYLDHNQTKLLLSEKEKHHKEALKKVREAKNFPIQSAKVVPENLVISKSGEPWISPSYDVTLTLISIQYDNTVIFQATPWAKYNSFSVGDMFELSTSSGFYRFIVIDTSYSNETANLKVLRVDKSN